MKSLLLNLTEWGMLKEQPNLIWYDWKSLKTDKKWTQIETVGEQIRRAGASESTVLSQSIDPGALNSAVINRVGP